MLRGQFQMIINYLLSFLAYKKEDYIVEFLEGDNKLKVTHPHDKHCVLYFNTKDFLFLVHPKYNGQKYSATMSKNTISDFEDNTINISPVTGRKYFSKIKNKFADEYETFKTIQHNIYMQQK